MAPIEYKNADQLNFLCIIATEMMGVNTLKDLPTLLSGFESIYKTLPDDVRFALTNVRLSGISPNTLRELTLMIEKYQDHHRIREKRKAMGERMEDSIDQRYIVNSDYTISPMWSKFPPDDVKEAIHSLTNEIPNRAYPEVSFHEPMRSGEINRGEKFNCAVKPFGFIPPDPPAYPVEYRGQAPGKVKWHYLIEIANEFDKQDVEASRQQQGGRSWFYRLHDSNENPTAELLKNQDLYQSSRGIHACALSDGNKLMASGASVTK